MELETWCTRKTRNGPKLVLQFRVQGGEFDGAIAVAWRNVEKLKGKPRERGQFVAKNPHDERSKYSQEWIQCVRPEKFRRDRMSPSKLKEIPLQGEIRIENGEPKVDRFWNPRHKNDTRMAKGCQDNDTRMPKEFGYQAIKHCKTRSDIHSPGKEMWQNNRLAEQQSDRMASDCLTKDKWLDDYDRELLNSNWKIKEK